MHFSHPFMPGGTSNFRTTPEAAHEKAIPKHSKTVKLGEELPKGQIPDTK